MADASGGPAGDGIEGLMLLAAWLSPSYPVGAYSYSHGLEWLVETGALATCADLIALVCDAVEHGAGRTDAILLAHAWRAARGAGAPPLADLVALARACQPARERLLEAEAQGAAFAGTTNRVWGLAVPDAPYPVAVGAAAGTKGLPLDETAAMYLQAFAANLVSAGVRLVPLGQTDGQRAVAALIPVCAAVAREAVTAGLDEIGGAGFGLDIAAMQHETQYTRIFRS